MSSVAVWMKSAIRFFRKLPATAPPLHQQAQHIMEQAAREARAMNHEYLGTEHILLGLLRERSGRVSAALAHLGLSYATVRQEVETMIQRGPELSVSFRKLPLTPRASQVLLYAKEESQGRIAPEALLLGLVRERSGAAADVLQRCGVSLDDVRGALARTGQDAGGGAG